MASFSFLQAFYEKKTPHSELEKPPQETTASAALGKKIRKDQEGQ